MSLIYGALLKVFKYPSDDKFLSLECRGWFVVRRAVLGERRWHTAPT